MTPWKIPPVIKVYEALGAIDDNRIEVRGDSAKVYSSSRGKSYDVIYDAEKNAITSNDNGSFFQGYLGYPAITYLLKVGVFEYDVNIAESFGGFAWKDINVKFKNDWAKTETYIFEHIIKQGWNSQVLREAAQDILKQIELLELNRLPSSQKPPKAY